MAMASVFTVSRKFVLAALLAGGAMLTAAGSAHALDLDQAKRDGLVGETVEGYLAAVDDSPSAAVTALVTEVNARRRAEYARIARENGIELEQVETLAAKKAIEKTRPGGWVRVDGTWRRK